MNDFDQLYDVVFDEEPTDDTFHDHVLLELHRLRVRAEAHRRFDQERSGDNEPFDAGTLGEILQRPPEPTARIDGLIPWEASTLITAQRKVGKTTLVLNLTRCLLTGETFLGTFRVQPVTRTITLLNFEVSAAQLAHWADQIGIDHYRLLQVNLRGRRNPLAHPDDRARLAQLIRDHDSEVLIVDPFSRAYTGSSQNDAGEVGAFLGDLDRFARSEAGCRDLILTAHAGWDGERTRGSSALEDWADSIITMNRDPDTDQRYIRATGRDVDLDESELACDGRRLYLSGRGSRKQARDEAKYLEQEQAVVDVLSDQDGPPSTSELERLVKDGPVGFQKGDVSRACHRLLDKGLVQFELGSRGAKLWSRVVIHRVA